MLKVIRYFWLAAGLFVLAGSDLQKRRIPNQCLCLLFVIRSVLLVAECFYAGKNQGALVKEFVSGLLLGGGIFLACYLLNRGAVGAGDVKMMAVVGYFIGQNRLLWEMFLIMLSAAIGVIYVCNKRKIHKKQLPFAPFVFCGTLLFYIMEYVIFQH